MPVSDLKYLKEYSDSDMDFVVEMIELFLDNTPGFVRDLVNALENKEFDTIAKTAHKMKPSMTFMGLSNGKELCVSIEYEAKNHPFEPLLSEKVHALDKLCQEAFVELKDELEKIKS